MIVPGWKDDTDYDDPLNWLPWIEAYAGKEAADAWYKAWMADTSPGGRMKTAQQYGISIFDWRQVAPYGIVELDGKSHATGNVFPYNSRDAAIELQRQINTLELKDVTVVSHSKGGSVVENLLDLYASGQLDKGAVKNAVIIDPPQLLIGGVVQSVKVDAKKAGVPTAFLPGAVACPGNVNCNPWVKNAMVFSWANTHEIRTEMATQVFSALKITNDAHSWFQNQSTSGFWPGS